MAFLELDDVTAGYDGVPAIRGISLTVGQGEVVALLGKSPDPVIVLGDFNRTAEQVRSTFEPALQLLDVPMTD